MGWQKSGFKLAKDPVLEPTGSTFPEKVVVFGLCYIFWENISAPVTEHYHLLLNVTLEMPIEELADMYIYIYIGFFKPLFMNLKTK